MQDSSHLTIILYSSVIKIVISQKQKFNRKIIITIIKFYFYFNYFMFMLCFPRK
jgi:hypothetical protein